MTASIGTEIAVDFTDIGLYCTLMFLEKVFAGQLENQLNSTHSEGQFTNGELLIYSGIVR